MTKKKSQKTNNAEKPPEPAEIVKPEEFIKPPKTEIEPEELGSQQPTLEEILRGLLAQTEALLTEVNELKSKMATKEYVNSSLIGGFETFAKNMQAPVEMAIQPSNGPAPTDKKNVIGGLTELGKMVIEGMKLMQPTNDPRLIQMANLGTDMTLAFMGGMQRKMKKELGIDMHLDMAPHGSTGTNP